MDQAGGQFASPELVDWFTNEYALPGGPWICPDAPLAAGDAPAPGSQGQWGTVATAWAFSNGWFFVWETNHILRAGSYAINWYLLDRALVTAEHLRGDFVTENQMSRPDLTPVAVDGREWTLFPRETDMPPSNLVTGDYAAVNVDGMSVAALPRHGNRPRPVPTKWPSNLPLPGAVDVGFYDGHCELIKPDNLWQLYWTSDWKPPLKRPGL
jgi:hypothetical protein